MQAKQPWLMKGEAGMPISQNETNPQTDLAEILKISVKARGITVRTAMNAAPVRTEEISARITAMITGEASRGETAAAAAVQTGRTAEIPGIALHAARAWIRILLQGPISISRAAVIREEEAVSQEILLQDPSLPVLLKRAAAMYAAMTTTEKPRARRPS